MKQTLRLIVSAMAASLLLPACSGHIKKTEKGTYTVHYKSYKSEEDARRQAVFEATLKCTEQGQKLNILDENKITKRGYLHSLEFECVD